MADKQTINAIFQESVAKHGAKTALRYKHDKHYTDISYAELAQRVQRVAAGLAAFGIEKGDRVCLLSNNRPEWAITDLAILALGCVTVAIYESLPAAQIAYILRNSESKGIIVSDSKQLKKVLEARKSTPDLQFVCVMEGDLPEGEAGVLTFATLEEGGKTQTLNDFVARSQAVQPDDIASLIYTSGTTGDPKGAMLTHWNFVSDVDASLGHFTRAGEVVDQRDTFLSFLPLSHAYERTTGYYLPLRVGATIAYAEGVFQLAGNMVEAQPTIMVCVPRVWESIHEKTLEAIAKEPESRRDIVMKALEVGRQYAEQKRKGGFGNPLISVQHAAYEKLVYSKLREKFGGKFRFLVAGGAALNLETARFFESIGLPLMEGYGMTEASPVIAANPNNKPKYGTVGIALPGVELKIAPDGEIFARGANVMKGYWKNEAATREMIDADGWLHTGDIGVLDSEGYLKITDRKKDILVLANGKNVAPQPIESALKQSPFISEIVLIGDKQNTITALVVPHKERLREFATAANLTFGDDDALLALPEVKKKIKQEIDAHSTALADFEKVKKFVLLNTVFTVEGGEMTPTLKVRRKIVIQKYARQIAEMQGGDGAAEG